MRHYGELVRITAEMILEHAQLSVELLREKRYREEFVFQLLKQGKSSGDELSAWALRLGVDLSLPRAAIVCEMGDSDLQLDKALRVIEQWQATFLAQRPDALVAAMSPRELAILIKFDGEQSSDRMQAYARQRLTHIDELVSAGQSVRPQLALGVALSGPEGMVLSYECARKTLRVGRQRQPKARLHSFYDQSLPVLLAGLFTFAAAGAVCALALPAASPAAARPAPERNRRRLEMNCLSLMSKALLGLIRALTHPRPERKCWVSGK